MSAWHNSLHYVRTILTEQKSSYSKQTPLDHTGGAGNKLVMILVVTVDGWLNDVNESLCLTDVMVGSLDGHT